MMSYFGVRGNEPMSTIATHNAIQRCARTVFRDSLFCDQPSEDQYPRALPSNDAYLVSPHIRRVQMHIVAARHVSHYLRRFNNTRFVLYTMDSESTPDRWLIQFQ